MLKGSKILVIDDDKDNLRFISKLMAADGFEVKTADSGAAGLKQLDVFGPDLVLLDINMPGIDGHDTIREIKQRKGNIAVVFVTGQSETDDVIRGLEEGALDYICKPFDSLELIARVRTQLRVKKLQDELREANKKLQDLVDIDDLTGLYNMRSVYEKLDNELARARRYNHGVGVIMMDMDHFKKVNDAHDHLFGSYVLSEIGKIIRQTIREVDFGARYGGDEFLVCLTHTNPLGAKKFCERLKKAIAEHKFEHKGDSIKMTASLGVAVVIEGKTTLDGRAVVKQADRALYESKKKGRDTISLIEIYDEIADRTLLRTRDQEKT